MPQISRKPISESLYKEITGELWWILTDIKDKKEMSGFLNDLFTRTEKIMLAKRLAMAALILRGWHWREICDFLHVSSATVMRMKAWLEDGGLGFKKAAQRLEKKERWEDFWKRVESVLPELPKSKSDWRGWSRLRYK